MRPALMHDLWSAELKRVLPRRHLSAAAAWWARQCLRMVRRWRARAGVLALLLIVGQPAAAHERTAFQ